MSHSAEKICRRILQCFTFFEYRKVLCIRGVCHDFLSKNFCLTILENLEVEPFCVSENFWHRIILWIRGGGEYHDFPSETYCRTVSKNFLAKPFCAVFHEICGSDKNYGYVVEGREYYVFLSMFFCFTLPKKFIREHFSVSFFWATIKISDQRGWSSRFLDEIVFSHSTKNFHRETLPRFRKILLLKLFMHKRGVSRFSVRNLLSHNPDYLRN